MKDALAQEEEIEEKQRRRRSSGDVSVIGGVKGGAMKASLPFSSSANYADPDCADENFDTEGYTKYDAEDDLDNFGLGLEIMSSQARVFYDNPGFEPDDPLSYPSDPWESRSQSNANAGGMRDPLPQTSPSGGVPFSSPNPFLKSSLKRRQPSDVTQAKGASGPLSALHEEESDDSAHAVKFEQNNLRYNVPVDVHSENVKETQL
ncbi:uncharacterized protein LOC108675563 [Hyalella azteca]|uniref:Uncharacterized protein LOC108675563 n=1 Tax=Hyalella azteca TaxID=294128 RepID=A0A8B7NZE8_HYAAZ|nr:uncharacterized protein LOC108675563 [Hyalella azteca]